MFHWMHLWRVSLLSCFCTSLLLFTSGRPVFARVVYVSPEGTPPRTGASWERAFRTISAGLIASSSGDELWVRGALYQEALTMKTGVAIYGGFAGVEESRSERDWDVNKTAIDSPEDYTPAVLGADAAILDGFIIKGTTDSTEGAVCCKGTSPVLRNCIIANNQGVQGAGFYCESASPTLINCVIANNSLANYVVLGLDSLGGGVCCTSNSRLTLLGCEISDNEANVSSMYGWGGGVYCDGSSVLVMKQCEISNNYARDYGGGLYCDTGSSATLEECILSGNTAQGAAGVCCYEASATLQNCLISNNYTRYESGGGLYAYASSPTLVDCTLSENAAAGGGGGIWFEGGTPTLTRCYIVDNRAQGSSSDGGGLYVYNSCPILNRCIIYGNETLGRYGWGGGAYYSGGSKGSLTNCLIANNRAAAWGGGGLYYYRSSPVMSHCTIVKNIAMEVGAGIQLDGASPKLISCILWNPGQEIWTSGRPENVDVTYSTIQGGWPGEGNIDAYPEFQDPDNGDFRLKDGSPCIDRGYAAGGPDEDLEGRPRPGGDSKVDMGCYESPDHYEPSAGVRPRVFFARSDAAPGGDGTTWDSAYAKIGHALEVASPSDEIWVAAGVYPKPIVLEPGVALYGGFQPGAVSREQRDWAANETIIDGSGFGTHTVVAADSATLDGFTITGGQADRWGGGGVLCLACSPTLRNCILIHNTAVKGGGLSCDSASPTVVNCIIAYNTATSSWIGGGGLYCENSSPKLINCVLARNTAASGDYGGAGGALYSTNCQMQLLNCTIADNICERTGGIYIAYGYKSSYLTNTILWNDNGDFNSVSSLEITFSNTRQRCPGLGNITANPRFVSSEDNNYHLQDGSACIDRGLVAGAPDTDFDGTPRPGGDGLVDMGAYESPDSFQPGPTYSVVFVRAGADRGGEGSSWATAYSTISEAIENHPAGEMIWVATGRYRESIELRPEMQVFGGFRGTEELLEQRANLFHETMIDADGLASSVVHGAPDALLDGFTLTGGHTEMGGGIRCAGGGEFQVRNCVIRDCTATQGGGLYLAQSSASIVNCAIVNNRALSQGGAVYSDNSSPRFEQCTLADNAARDGGGFYGIQETEATLQGCILWNTGREIVLGPFPPIDPDEIPSMATVSYSAVEGSWPGVGNISDYPSFADRSAGNYRLAPDSPCIDTGCNEGILDTYPMDLNGNLRVWDGDGDGVAVVDMGAYEFGSFLPTQRPGDIDQDGVLNYFDPFLFSRHWYEEENETDLSYNPVEGERVEEVDLLRLLPAWR